jgi:hypothetical protein
VEQAYEASSIRHVYGISTVWLTKLIILLGLPTPLLKSYTKSSVFI